MFNSVMFVSLGPGDPELITLKGLKVLQQADVIFSPSTASSSRAMNIMRELEIEETKVTLFNVPMSKDRSKAIESYKAVSQEVIKLYRKGLKIAIVAEGDAGFYSSIHYINDELNAVSIPVKRIEGIPAFIACGALANLHIVKQEEELAVVPGIIIEQALKEKIKAGKTVVIMKPSQCEEIIKNLLLETIDFTFHYFENVGIPDKEFYTFDKSEIIPRKFPYFSLLIIRK